MRLERRSTGALAQGGGREAGGVLNGFARTLYTTVVGCAHISVTRQATLKKDPGVAELLTDFPPRSLIITSCKGCVAQVPWLDAHLLFSFSFYVGTIYGCEFFVRPLSFLLLSIPLIRSGSKTPSLWLFTVYFFV